MSDPVALSNVSLPDLRTVLHAVTGEVPCPLTKQALSALGLTHAADNLVIALADCDEVGVRTALQVAIAERIHRPRPVLDLVWTGPAAKGTVSRDTAVVVRELFRRAQNSVLVGGFRFDHGESLFKPLYRSMKDRGVSATLFLDIEGTAEVPAKAEVYAKASVTAFFKENWPFGDPVPIVYYDPNTARPGPPWVSLHAKFIVVDASKTLITSANFTDRGQTRNIESGVLVEDVAFARQVATQWTGLVDAGHVTRFDGERVPSGT